MPNICENDNNHEQNDDYFPISLDQKNCHKDFFSDKLVSSDFKQTIYTGRFTSTCFVGQKANKSLKFGKFDDVDYDSTEQKQKDKSSSLNNDESLEKNKTNGIQYRKSNYIKSYSIDIENQYRLRGILKYPPGWPKQSVSESDTSLFYLHSLSDDYGYYDTSVESPEILLDCFKYDNENLDDGDLNKPKKCVTFSDKITTYVFRPNSSILARRQKNQKKAKKKKERELKKLSCSPSNEDSLKENYDSLNRINDKLETVKYAINFKRYSGTIPSYDDDDDDDVSSYTSTDVSSSSGCDTSASECSADEMSAVIEERLNSYEEECKSSHNDTSTSKSRRKNRRRRNRKNKLTIKTFLETGGYDSD